MTVSHQRLDIHGVDPKAHQAVFAFEHYVRESGLDPRRYELVKIRASQLNGCAFCLDTHNRDAHEGAVATHQQLPAVAAGRGGSLSADRADGEAPIAPRAAHRCRRPSTGRGM